MFLALGLEPCTLRADPALNTILLADRAGQAVRSVFLSRWHNLHRCTEHICWAAVAHAVLLFAPPAVHALACICLQRQVKAHALRVRLCASWQTLSMLSHRAQLPENLTQTYPGPFASFWGWPWSRGFHRRPINAMPLHSRMVATAAGSLSVGAAAAVTCGCCCSGRRAVTVTWGGVGWVLV